MEMKFLLALVIAVSAVLADDCDYQTLKDCNTFEKLISLKNFPQNISQLTNVCNLFKDGDTCVKAFNDKCVKNPKAKSIANKIDAGLVMHYNDVCGSDKGKQDFLKRVNMCYSKEYIVREFAYAHQRYVGMAEKLATYEPKAQLPIYCCAIEFFREKISLVSDLLCARQYIDYRNDALMDILRAPFDEVCSNTTTGSQICVDDRLTEAQKDDFYHIAKASPPLATKLENALPTLYEVFNRNFNQV